MGAKSYSGELAILNDIIGDRSHQYRTAPWLKSPYEAPYWNTSLGRIIDFRVRFGSGLLTDRRHHGFLDTLKAWLCAQAHIDTATGKIHALATQKAVVAMTMHLIDYFLLHKERLGLESHGFRCITTNDLDNLLLDLASEDTVQESIYRWRLRLSGYLRTKISTVEASDEAEALREYPLLDSPLPPIGSRLLDLSDREVQQARIWLYLSGYYRDASKKRKLRSPVLTRIAKILYADTLSLPQSFCIPPELKLEAGSKQLREFTHVPTVGKGNGVMKAVSFGNYTNVLKTMGTLVQAGFEVPTESLRNVSAKQIADKLGLSPPGRFKSIPQALVLSSLKTSIEFAIEFGDSLVDAYLNVAGAAHRAGLSINEMVAKQGIESFIDHRLNQAGLVTWSAIRCNRKRIGLTLSQSRARDIEKLRSNAGLWELILVLYGAILICVGTLMARRVGELQDLVAGKCLDNTGRYLIFDNRKSGILGMRQSEARPIPLIGTRFVRLIERLQFGLIDIGVLKEPTQLFAAPTLLGLGLSGVNSYQLYGHLDRFCDYVKTPTTTLGERYYIRPHQLRRFFATLFFWGRSFGGMDTLRWFMGHTNLRHLYNYITEETPGSILASVKAEYATDLLKQADSEAAELADLLFEHFHTRNFSILDNAELNEYIEELIADGEVQIEPHFITTPDGQDYRVHITVKSKEVHEA